ncbi:MAG: anthrone oxygenase family protein [Pseudomonadota bacterium]
MTLPVLSFVCLFAGIACVLVAGVFLAFSDFIMRGLAQAEPVAGIDAMQQINRTVLRSVFLFLFFALAPITAAIAGYAWFRVDSDAQPLMIGAAAIYLVTVVAVTVVGNVPMNERLAAMPKAGDSAATYWPRYCQVWTWLNHVRTLGSTSAAICLLLAATLS